MPGQVHRGKRRLRGSQIPHPRRQVFAPDDEPASVRGERNVVDRAFVPGQVYVGKRRILGG